MGAGEQHNPRAHRCDGLTIQITNKTNPHLAARLVAFTHCGFIMAIVLTFIGIIFTIVGAAMESDMNLYRGVSMLGVAFIATVTGLILCVCVVKPSCCYPKDRVVGISVGGRLITAVGPSGVGTQPNGTAVIVVGGSQPVNSQYNTNYGNTYGQPVAPPQYGTSSVPPPSYDQSTMYPPPSEPKAIYSPPPPY